MGHLPKQPFANPALPVHHALALEAAACAEQVLPLFEQAHPHDTRPRHAVATLRQWVQGQASMLACRQAALAAHAAAVAHMYTHAPHVAAYAAKAVTLAALPE